MQQHLTILGWLYIIFGGLGLLAAVFILLVMGGSGVIAGDAQTAALLSGIGLFVAVIVAVLSVPSIIAGWGLLKRKSWSRVLAIILGALNILNFPLGTVVGIYTIWALTQSESQRLLSH
ncbi:MAG TPA: hypothetical protein VD835_08610 [Pyrinomonadaceae bacterium]|nr:hypothetical protein [Pyrinomonadaceae bacterium]